MKMVELLPLLLHAKFDVHMQIQSQDSMSSKEEIQGIILSNN